MAATYNELLSEIEGYLGRPDLKDKLPSFVKLAEARMNREMRLKVMEREATTNVASGQRNVALPDKRVSGDWDVFLEMRDLRLNGTLLKNLDYVALQKIPEARDTGTPYAYSIRGRELILVPAPDTQSGLLMDYFAEIPPLGETQPTNDVLLRFPDLYLYGALVASCSFSRSSAPLEVWGSFYNAAAEAARKSDVHGRFTPNYALPPIRSV